MELADFLLARIAEDEAVAREATPSPWSLDKHDDKTEPRWAIEGPVPDGERWPLTVVGVSSDRDYGNPEGGCERREDAEHIALHDPARVLAECEAKRRIVEQLWLYVSRPDPTSSDPSGTQAVWIVKTLASPYADHPDYRQEWKP